MRGACAGNGVSASRDRSHAGFPPARRGFRFPGSAHPVGLAGWTGVHAGPGLALPPTPDLPAATAPQTEPA